VKSIIASFQYAVTCNYHKSLSAQSTDCKYFLLDDFFAQYSCYSNRIDKSTA
jgi:hypothetical protein